MSPFPWTCNIPGFTTSSLYWNQSSTGCSDKSFNFTDITLTTCHQFNKRLKYQTASQDSASRFLPAQLQGALTGEPQAEGTQSHSEQASRFSTALQGLFMIIYVPACIHVQKNKATQCPPSLPRVLQAVISSQTSLGALRANTGPLRFTHYSELPINAESFQEIKWISSGSHL